MTDQYKQVLVVRRDLDLSPGKLGAQVAHAAERAARSVDDNVYDSWAADGSMKVVLAADDEQQLKALRDAASERDLPLAFIRDQGRTELAPDTATALGIGPAANERVDEVTGNLSLY